MKQIASLLSILWLSSSRALQVQDSAIERTRYQAIELASERSSDRAIARSSDRVIERSSDRATIRSIEQAIERSSDRVINRSDHWSMRWISQLSTHMTTFNTLSIYKQFWTFCNTQMYSTFDSTLTWFLSKIPLCCSSKLLAKAARTVDANHSAFCEHPESCFSFVSISDSKTTSNT